MEKTEDTQEKYSNISIGLVKRYFFETGREWAVDPLSFAHWLGSRKKDISSYTWRLYRASVRYFIEEHKPEYLGRVLDTLDKYSSIPAKTSARKKKKFVSEDDWKKLLEHYSHSSSRALGLAVMIIQAGVWTGLRPNEWAQSRLEENMLIVKNSKNSHGRSFGEYRHLDISQLSEDQKELIAALVGVAHDHSDKKEWLKTLDTCRQTLSFVTKKLGISGLTLYSARHQAASNAREAGMSPEELAAFMGHASTKTAKDYYGKSGTGRKMHANVSPDASDVQSVSQAIQDRVHNPIQQEIE